jgi:hypothetical protein
VFLCTCVILDKHFIEPRSNSRNVKKGVIENFWGKNQLYSLPDSHPNLFIVRLGELHSKYKTKRLFRTPNQNEVSIVGFRSD